VLRFGLPAAGGMPRSGFHPGMSSALQGMAATRPSNGRASARARWGPRRRLPTSTQRCGAVAVAVPRPPPPSTHACVRASYILLDRSSLALSLSLSGSPPALWPRPPPHNALGRVSAVGASRLPPHQAPHPCGTARAARSTTAAPSPSCARWPPSRGPPRPGAVPSARRATWPAAVLGVGGRPQAAFFFFAATPFAPASACKLASYASSAAASAAACHEIATCSTIE